MPDKLEYLVKLGEFEFDDAKVDSGWLHVFTLGTVWDKRYGFIEITPTRVRRFAANVNDKILGTDVPVDFSHMNGPDGERAAGWGTKAVTTDPNGSNEDGLWLWVDWTPRAANEIRGGEWKYASAMFTEIWSDARGHQHQDVLLGTALTNHPVLKDLTPINLSEFHDDDEVVDYLLDNPTLLEHFELAAVDNSPWDGNAAMTNCKGASDYRAICAGRREGDPNKRETWALPHHKTPGAPPNRGGVSSALGRFDQTQGLVNKDGARRHLEAHQKAMKNMSDDLGGEMDIKLLATFFGLAEDATEDQVLAKAKEAGAAFAARQADEEKAKTFAEQFPEQAAELEANRKTVADLTASNRLSAINSDIDKLLAGGVPAKFADEIRELRTKLSDDADVAFGKLLQEIVTEGLVPLTERGSSGKDKGDTTDKTFADIMSDIKDEHEDWDQKKVYAEARKTHPELEREYIQAGRKGGE